MNDSVWAMWNQVLVLIIFARTLPSQNKMESESIKVNRKKTQNPKNDFPKIGNFI
jgi:hypothetical protein